MTNEKTNMLRVLQAGRAIAALMVVLYHLNISIWGVPKYFPHEFATPFSFGNSGVQFFFVLSGFIIFYVHRNDVGRPAVFGRFWRKRFLRVYLPYWIVLAIVIPVALSVSKWGHGYETEPLALFTSVTLLPHPLIPVLHVAWTLKHEVLFYAIFSICILHARLGFGILAIWQIGCIAVLAFGDIAFPMNFFFSPNNILFLFGMVAAFVVLEYRVPAAAPLTVFGVAAFLLVGLQSVYATHPYSGPVYILYFGMAAAIGIVGATTLEGRGQLKVPRLFVVLGDASYSIYLVHFLALSLGVKLLFASGLAGALPEALSFLLLFIGGTASGLGFYYLIEAPLLARFVRGRRLSDPAKA